LRHKLSEIFSKIKDARQSSKIDISLHDALMSGFACMHFQDSSILQFQRRMQEEQHRNNLETLFNVKDVPKGTQMREIIDGVDSNCFRPIFKNFYLRLQRGKQLERYQIFEKENMYYFPMDGTQFYSSKDISCEHCLVKEHKRGSKTYSHQVLQGGIAHPDCPQVIPFMPEQIINSDGSDKQDCEMNAAKRYIKRLRKDHPQLNFLLGGDSLFSKQPIIENALSLRMHYLFAAKPDDHKYMMEWLSHYPSFHRLEFTDDRGKIHTYEWMNNVPLNGNKDTVMVNFLRCNVSGRINRKGKQEKDYSNSWVTDITISEENIRTLVQAGRCRWRNENEMFNVMKNHGYCADHNYGHGEKNLAFNFYLLTLLAFFFHQIFELTDRQYQACRKKHGSKRYLWETLRGYFNLLIFKSWEQLLAFALAPNKKDWIAWADTS
jgi:hypothetical protein